MSEGSTNALARWGVADGQLTNGQRWMCFWCLFFLGMIGMYSFLKVSPVLMVIGESIGMGLDTVGNVMGFFNIAGIIIAFPVVWIMRQFGVKFSLVLTCVVSLLGSCLGLIATTPGLFLFSRVLEGAGMGMIAAVGPNVMPRLFPMSKMGFVMGVWSVWNVPGILLATIVGPMVVTATGDIKLLWWINIVLGVIALIWILACCKMNAENENEIAAREMAESGAAENRPVRNFVLSASVASFSFIGYAALFGQFQNFYPTFLQSQGFDMMASTLPATICCVLTVPASIIAGIVINRFPIKKTILVLTHVLLGVIMGFVAFIDGGQGWLPMCLLMVLVSGFMPVALRTIIPMQVTDTRKMDYVLCIMAFVTNLGAFWSGPWGAMVDSMGWSQAAIYGLFPIAVVMAILCLVFVKSEKQVLEG